MALTTLLLVSATLALSLAAPIILDESTADVITKSGPVRGLVKDGAAQFLSIPYAAPPVGSLRWMPPQHPQSWTETLDVTSRVVAQKRMCPQRLIGPLWGQEDCLYLNVFAPHPLPAEPLPVMFWMYGGGFNQGDGLEFHLYNGAHLARDHNVIVVTHNYRIGPFGFLSADALREEAGANNSTGNYGTMDQRFAMEWTRDNIAAFGGNPDLVTIFGESAGAFSVCYHIASPGSAGLFKHAIMESGNCESTGFFQTYANATRFSSEYMAAIGCDSSKLSKADFLACGRNLTMEQVMHDGISGSHAAGDLPLLYPVLPWGPTVDGTDVALPDIPISMIRSGRFNRVPVLLGSNRDEGSVFILMMKEIVPGTHLPMHKEDFGAVVAHFFNETFGEQVAEMYPEADYRSADVRTSMIVRDFFFTCPARTLSRTLHSFGVPAFLYQFTFNFGGPEYAALGDYHSSELNFVWGNALPPLAGVWNAKHKQMSAVFQQYWTNMARAGSPNTGGGNATTVEWPQYALDTDLNLVLDQPVKTNANLQQRQCDMWSQYRWPKSV